MAKKEPKIQNIDECPVRGCGAHVPNVDCDEVFEGSSFVCAGPKKHFLTAFVSDGKAWLQWHGGKKPKKKEPAQHMEMVPAADETLRCPDDPNGADHYDPAGKGVGMGRDGFPRCAFCSHDRSKHLKRTVATDPGRQELEDAARRFLYRMLGQGNIQGDGSDDEKYDSHYAGCFKAAEDLCVALGIDLGDLRDYVNDHGSEIRVEIEVAEMLGGPPP